MDRSSCFRQIDSFIIFLLTMTLVSVWGCHTPGISLFSLKKIRAESKQRTPETAEYYNDLGAKKNTIIPGQGTPFSKDGSSSDELYRPEVLDLTKDCFPQSGDSEELLVLIEELNDNQSLSMEEKQKILGDIRSVDPRHQEYLIAMSHIKLSEEKDQKVDSQAKMRSLDFVASSPQESPPDEASPKSSGTHAKNGIQQVGYEDIRSITEAENRTNNDDTPVLLVALDLPPDIMRSEDLRSQPTVSLGKLDRIKLTPDSDIDTFNSSSTRITPIEQPSRTAREGQFPPNFQRQYDLTSSSDGQNNSPRQIEPSPTTISLTNSPISRQSVSQPDVQLDTQPANTSIPQIASRRYAPLNSMMPTRTPSYINAQENWEQTVEQAAASLYNKLSQSPNQQAFPRDEINLRLLHLALGNQREVTRPVTGVSPELQQFWHDELLGLSTLMDQQLIPDPGQRYSVAHQHFVQARSHLKTACPIRIPTLQFIKYCEGFGVYEPASNKFEPGSQTVLYAELDNFNCQKVNEGEYLTKVSSSYEFLDSNGMVVAEGSYGIHERVTQCEVRDVFIVLKKVTIPANLVPGRYYFNLFVNDLNNPTQKSGQQQVEFSVIP